ncbi:Globoside alpha-1,3-N-acetylgalactosaminyltransferase 1 [Channa argus]|uniref:Globoside alpha-1,3-N-acetylgalactosaminyltransferase 1 n=1 Tax=Channa argus TaxID=215402 RepID=A0A6G1PHG5_CHAAH|nr:Globoside alpha-1,3-N-acetylgalactosaminyltransferase 1 [Channa argus]
MALFPFCKSTTDFLHGRKAAVSVKLPHTTMDLRDRKVPQTPMETQWGAPLVWGETHNSALRRSKFGQQEIRAGLLTLVVGTYGQFIRRFLSSAETYFLPGQMVTYYILTDNPRSLDPPVKLGPQRQLKVLPIAELPRWDRLAYRRMALVADAIKDQISSEVEYIFCADVDQEFVAPVGEEILGDLVATLHPELYGRPRNAFPYETEEVSSACVEQDEGDYYYTSELYGGLVSEMYKLARACSLLILQDSANKIVARGLEESYLNRYLIDHRPTCVLSPEYSWWSSPLTAEVPVRRLVSLGRQCKDYDRQKKEEHKC